MSEDNRAIVPLGLRGVVASVNRQLAITEKLVGKIQSAQDLLDVFNMPQVGRFEDAIIAIVKGTNTHGKAASNSDKSELVLEIDDQLYEQIKPYLEEMWAAAKVTYHDYKEALQSFYDRVLDSMGEDFDPYVVKFYREIKASENAQISKELRTDIFATGSEIDDTIYEQLKPHLNKAWEAAKTTYSNNPEALDSFLNKFTDAMGEKVIPYMKKFYIAVRAIEIRTTTGSTL